MDAADLESNSQLLSILYEVLNARHAYELGERFDNNLCALGDCATSYSAGTRSNKGV